MVSPVPPGVNVDDWTIRCLFNRAHLYERALANEIHVTKDVQQRRPTKTHPYHFNANWNYYDRPGGIHLGRSHHFLYADGVSIGASGKTDPKMVLHNGLRHEQIEGDDNDPNVRLARDPSKKYRYKSLRWRVYVFWRKRLKCPLFHR